MFFKGNFHGRSISVCGGSLEKTRRYQFGPFFGKTDIVDYNDLDKVEKCLSKHKDNYSFVLTEPI